MDQKIVIGVVIITYNSNKWIDLCIESLLSNTISVQYIFIIDNCSQEMPILCKKNQDDKIQIFQLKKNIGFGSACNFGIYHCLKMQCDYILLVNPDTELKKNTIHNLLIPFNIDKNIGIVGGLELFHKNGQYNSFTTNNLSKAISDNNYRNFIYSNFSKGDILNGSLLLFKKDVFTKIGGFDPIYFMFCEDNDLLRRAKNHFNLAISKNSVYYHDMGHSYKNIKNESGISPLKLSHFFKSSFIYALTNPYTHFLYNFFRLFILSYKFSKNFYKKPNFFINLFNNIQKIPWKQCYLKWKNDYSKKQYGHYIHEINKFEHTKYINEIL